MAEAAGVTRGSVNRLENGKPASIDFAVFEKLVDALGADPGYLIVRRRREGGVGSDGMGLRVFCGKGGRRD